MASSKERSLGDSWFNAPARVSEAPLSEAPSLIPASVGRLGWALTLAAVGGAGGGAVMLLVARAAARRFAIDVDIVRTVGRSVVALGVDTFTGGLLIAGAVGGAIGALLGALLRYSLRVVPRLLASALLAPILWTFAHAFVLKSFAPSTLGALPFGPMIAGAAVYGICVAILPPPRERTAAD
jgi:hypothetical protein